MWLLKSDLPKQLVGYGIAGLLAAAVHLAVLYALVEFFFVAKTLASAVGFATAIPVNYFIQYHFVFQSRVGHVRGFLRYFEVTLFFAGVNTGLFWLLLNFTPINYVVIQIITIITVAGLNFVVNRQFTFSAQSQ